MSRDILLMLQDEFQNNNISEEKAQNICAFISNYKVNSWVYPGVIKRKFNIDIKLVYRILNLLQKNGYVESYFEVCCKVCKRSLGDVYRSYDDIPDVLECGNCGTGTDAPQNAYMIYKVI